MNTKPTAAVLFAVSTVFAACECRGEPASDQHAARPEHTLVGQLLLPNGLGKRGIEVMATVAAPGDEPRVDWLLFDEQGRFAHTFRGILTKVEVVAGIGVEVHRIDSAGLHEANPTNQIDIGVIDLRDRLARHPMTLRAADEKAQGDVRIAMCFGPPPVGPSGEPVSLGSRQFPPVALGSKLEWLLPHEARSIYFLVERPAGSGRGRQWRSGRQQLFGPFSAADLPTELIVD